MDESSLNIVEINVGGSRYTTTLTTLTKDPSSLLAKYFAATTNQENNSSAATTAELPENLFSKIDEATYFVDRDGLLFRYILDYLRNGKLVLPDNFREHQRLKDEAKFYKLNDLAKIIKLPTTTPSLTAAAGAVAGGAAAGLRRGSYHAGTVNGAAATAKDTQSGYITVGYRGTFAFGRDGQADVKFRKLTRILVCGRAHLCKEVFGDTLNESRDPDRGGESRYTARLFLKHCSLEWAFDMLNERGFQLLASCASGTCSAGNDASRSGPDGEEQRWNHYNEFVFYRPSNFGSF